MKECLEVFNKLNDVRKIASTSNCGKFFESFLVEFIVEDISEKLSKRQYGGRKGVGTGHMLVTMVDRIKLLLEDPEIMLLCSLPMIGRVHLTD